MDISDWQFERLSRSSVRRLREDGIDMTLIAMGAKKKEITSVQLRNIKLPRAHSAKTNNYIKESYDDHKNVNQREQKVTPSLSNKMTTVQKKNASPKKVPKKTVRKKNEPKPELTQTIKAESPTIDENTIFLQNILEIGDLEIIRRIADFARSLTSEHNTSYIHNVPEDICKKLDEDDEVFEQTNNVIVEEPDDTDQENSIYFLHSKENNSETFAHPVVPWKKPRILQVGQVVQTTVTTAENMPNVPVVRIDKIVNRLVEVDGRKIQQTIPSTAADHVDATMLTANQIKEFEKQGFVLRTMKVAERDAIFSGR